MKATGFRLSLAAVVVATLLSNTAGAVDRTKPPTPGAVAPFAITPPKAFTLKNGLRVYFLERRRLPLVSVTVSVGAGALMDPAGKEGTAVAVSDLLTEGAGDKDAFAFDDALQAIGGEIGAGADWQRTTIGASGLSGQLKPLLGLLADAIIRPRLDDTEWERVRGETIGTLAYYANEPRALSALAAARALFPTGRQGTAIIGTPRSVSTIAGDDLRALHARAFRPDNAFVVIVGDLSEGQALSALEGAFGSWVRPTTPIPTVSPLEPAPLQKPRVVLLNRPGAAQSALQIVAAIPPNTQPLDAAASVMQTLLGGSFTSRLNTNLREVHGYAYGAGYDYDVEPAHRSRVSTSVATPVTAPAIAEILGELKRIRTEPTEEELVRARAYEALTFPGNLDGGGAMAGAWATWKALGVKDEDVTSFMSRVLKVNAADVADAGQRLVDPNGVAIVVVGDAAALKGDLGRFGTVVPMTAAELLPAP